VGARGTMFLAGAVPAAVGVVCLLAYLRVRPMAITPPAAPREP